MPTSMPPSPRHPDPPNPVGPHASSPAELKDLLAFERSGEPFLAFRDATGQLRLLSLNGTQAVTVGRREGMDVALSWDGLVSGLHAELQCLGGEWALVDDGLSTNGTFVNSERVTGRRRLRGGDRIQAGGTVIVFNEATSPPPVATLASGERAVVAPLTDQQRRVLVALCRPYKDGDRYATPATNQQIADELFLSVDAVKMHLRALCLKFDVHRLPQNQKRLRLAESALHLGVIGPRDL
jgi:pSer/pThr/pTyr-binding forkhead associated (FHA) protein